MKNEPSRRSLLVIIFIGILAVSSASILIRMAQQEANSLVIAAYRLTIASLVLLPICFINYRAALQALTRRDMLLAVLSGLFLAIHFATWITSLAYTSIASSVVLVSTHPFWVTLATLLIFREVPARPTLTGLILALVGGAIVGFGDIGIGANEWLGDILALLGALAAAGYFLIGRHLRSKLSLIPYITLVYGTSAILLISFCLITGQRLSSFSPTTYLWLILLGIVPQLIGHSSFNYALRYLSATFVAVTVLGEPIGSSMLAFLILNETPTAAKLLGGGLILAGIFLASRTEQAVPPRGNLVPAEVAKPVFSPDTGMERPDF
ncbi:MAG: DMT family transporter [Chloroflexi bacterium]|nr:DMT family transporter [Chloroflexota bacterium]